LSTTPAFHGPDLRPLCGKVDFVWIVLDSLRYDVAERALAQGRLPGLQTYVSNWERRHTPGNFTLPAHQAFFAGFLPTPLQPARRNLALAFEGSTTIEERTLLLDGANVCEGLRARGYRSVCIGGVGFFNKRTPLSRVLPDLFDESHWEERTGVTDPRSTEHQVDLALARLVGPPVFLFLNISATHQPNCHYLPGATEDSPETQLEALAYVDSQLQRLWPRLEERGAHCWVFSDHGTAYGEEGRWGHRLNHEVVWTVPYAEFGLNR